MRRAHRSLHLPDLHRPATAPLGLGPVGSLDVLEDLGIKVEYLIAGYAVLTVPEHLVDRVAELTPSALHGFPVRQCAHSVRPCSPGGLPYLFQRSLRVSITDIFPHRHGNSG